MDTPKGIVVMEGKLDRPGEDAGGSSLGPVRHRHGTTFPGVEPVSILERLLDYELRAAARYRRFAALVMVTSDHKEHDVTEMLNEQVRGSDEFLQLGDDAVAILMGETDSSDALVAVKRYKSRCQGGEDLRFAVVSYPADGRGTSELLSAASRRLRAARAGGRGAIVSTG